MSSISTDLAALFTRDLARLARQLDAFDDAHLWRVLPGVTNSAGNLMLHLNGNLRAFIGLSIGGVAYVRDRPREFGATDVPRSEIAADLAELATLIPQVLEAVTPERWAELFPENVLGTPLSNRHFVIHLYGHLNYHLGQIDYLRRVLTGQGALTKPA
ncbi:MAG TPA: DinB family protein [Vicinamibacterales bacterium]|nr:DinB family protein [Vicinamibacterales bacterium]